ncbi:MAG: tetratricopeptide repeat protein [Flavobacterium sp.]|nr:MAG: tetratricopeptide repeat protein [Flavobacterium sp.]
MKYVQRHKLDEGFNELIQCVDNQYLHIHGLAGSGKTFFIKQCHYLSSKEKLFLDYSELEELTIELLIKRIVQLLCDEKAIKAFNERVSLRINQEVFYNTGYRKSHILKVHGTLNVHRDVILGDVHNYGESDAKSKKKIKYQILTEELIKLLEKKRSELFIIIDRAERHEGKIEVIDWLTYQLIPTSPLFRIITISRNKKCLAFRSLKSVSHEICSFSEDEVEYLADQHGITDHNDISTIKSISRLHPLSVVLVIRALQNMSSANLRNSHDWDTFSQKLIMEFLIEKILEDENKTIYKNALLILPMFRFFIADTFDLIKEIPRSETQKILNHFEDLGFIEKIGNSFKFHDLLFELINKYIKKYHGINYYKQKHEEIYLNYMKSSAPDGHQLMYTIEPLYHIFTSDPLKANSYFEKICKYALDRKNKILAKIILNEIDFSVIPMSPEKGWYYLRLAGYFREFDQFEIALNVLEKSKDHAKNDMRLLASIYNNFGWVYLYFQPDKNIDAAIICFNESNNICTLNDFSDIIGKNYNNLGIAMERKSRYPEAIELYEKSLEITNSTTYYEPIVSAKSLRNLGLLYLKQKSFDSAINFFQQALRKYEESHDYQSQGEILFLLAQIYYRKKNYKHSLNISIKAEKRLLINAYGNYLSENYLLMSRALLEIDSMSDVIKCLVNFLITSLNISRNYHQISVRNLSQFLRIIAINKSKIEACNIAIEISSIWKNEKNLNKIPLSQFINDSLIPDIKAIKFWKLESSTVIHTLSSKCKTSNLEKLTVFPKYPNIPSQRCKRC